MGTLADLTRNPDLAGFVMLEIGPQGGACVLFTKHYTTPFRVIWALRPHRPLPTGTSVPGARAPPLALPAGGMYAPTSATLLSLALGQAGLYEPSPAL